MRVATINDAVVSTVNEGDPYWIEHRGLDGSSLESGDAVPHTPWDFSRHGKKRHLDGVLKLNTMAPLSLLGVMAISGMPVSGPNGRMNGRASRTKFRWFARLHRRRLNFRRLDYRRRNIRRTTTGRIIGKSLAELRRSFRLCRRRKKEAD